ncbi:phosphonate C-P lyase system protein PhnL [Marinomonas sp. C2222]|uniref:Phosphonate C-P lyase system protein PhnL n=1 Tax=Marinomonas sargassi TaxID=2984494 RepID=A0ABT2YPY4_9GAMM|nr:phosphonate C-P lyase system protein PhnL [Marinomonas sargassi]MCV2401825.1 phosphonate C-P lyase system protein PhnL [Marinomonas sargassi]
MTSMIHIEGLSKTFTLHNQGGIQLPILDNIHLEVFAGKCTVLFGESGSGKSTLLRSLYANYLPSSGAIHVRHNGEMIDLACATSHQLLEVRRQTIGYVSQFLRVIPRVSTLDVVKQPLRDRGIENDEAESKAVELLTRLNIPERLWSLAPSTFSGGEQQRVNIARGFIQDYPILLLDEPTASLDQKNTQIVIELIQETLAKNTAVVGIFHDADVREALADHVFDVSANHLQPKVKIA